MLRPTSPRPPSGVMRRPFLARRGGADSLLRAATCIRGFTIVEGTGTEVSGAARVPSRGAAANTRFTVRQEGTFPPTPGREPAISSLGRRSAAAQMLARRLEGAPRPEGETAGARHGTRRGGAH